MKKIIFIICLMMIFLISCKESNCEFSDPTCTETPPTDEECLAVFERWFYDSATTSCEKISYSGCEVYGFETKAACETCQCD